MNPLITLFVLTENNWQCKKNLRGYVILHPLPLKLKFVPKFLPIKERNTSCITDLGQHLTLLSLVL